MEFFRRLRYYFRRGKFEAELEEEMAHHAALSRKLAGAARIKEDSRSAWGWTFAEQLAQDLRYALRAMANNRVFTMLAVLSLALGIGANTAIFSFLDSIMLRSLPVQDPERLVRLEWTSKDYPKLIRAFRGDSYRDGSGRYTSAVFPYPSFELFLNDNAVFESLFIFGGGGRPSVIVRGQADNALSFYSSAGLFTALKLQAAAGRFFTEDENRPGAAPVAVLSFAYAQRQFGDIRSAIGQSITIVSVPYTIVGVTPPEFFGVNPARVPDLYLPIQPMGMVSSEPNSYWAQMMARLRPGVSIQQAEAALAPRFHQFVESTARSGQERIDIPALSLQKGAGGVMDLRRRYSKPLWVLMSLVGLVLALACANMSNLLLARAEARRREMAVRLSIGAGRWRVIRQLLTESLVLAGMGGALGVGFAVTGVQTLNRLLANGGASNMIPAELNWRVLAMTAALAILTGLVMGLAPALQAVRVDVMPVLKNTRAGAARLRSGLIRFSASQALVVSQVAMTLLLLVAAGLFARTLGNLRSLDLGFNEQRLLLFDVSARQAGYSSEAATAFYRRLQQQLRELPGVRNVGVSTQALVAGEMSTFTLSIPGVPREKSNNVSSMDVGPGFFETMEIRLLAGRAIEERDLGRKPQSVVVNQRFVESFFPGRDPVGQTFSGVEIVGVSQDAQYGLLQDGIPALMYRAMGPSPFRVVFALRTSGDPQNYIGAARDALRQLDARIPLAAPRTQAGQIAQTTYRERMFAQLSSSIALLALFIASLGLYATMAHNVTRRTNEIGVRMALGAQRRRLVWMILREAGVMMALGVAIGLPVALAASRYLESFLFGLKPNDPFTMAAAAAALMAAAGLAALGPARRASRVDPMIALRHE